jgi:hypothetical protein
MAGRKLKGWRSGTGRHPPLLRCKSGEMFYEIIIKTLIVVVFLLTVINLYNVFIRYQNVNYITKRIVRAIEIEGQVNSSVDSLFNQLNNELGLNASYRVVNVSYFDASRRVQLRDAFTVEVTATYDFQILSPLFGPPVVIPIPLTVNITGISEVYWKP